VYHKLKKIVHFWWREKRAVYSKLHVTISATTTDFGQFLTKRAPKTVLTKLALRWLFSKTRGVKIL